jgi:transcriptional regulator with XRE-family HTH domain
MKMQGGVNMNKNFGDYLYALRTEKGWTQQHLADLLGVTNKTVSKWERNEGYPSIETLLSLSKLFNVSVDELLKGGNNSNQENSMEILLQGWQSKKMAMITNVVLFIGLFVFFSIYFLVHQFAISFFVFLVFALLSGGLLFYRQEKLLYLMKQERNKKEIIEWICYLGICICFLFPCAIGEFVTYTIIEGFEVSLHITFKDYLITWLPLCVALAMVFAMAHKATREDLFQQIKGKLKRILILFSGVVLAFVIFFGLIPTVKSYPESNYKQLKANYLSLVDSFDGEAFRPSIMNPHFENKKRYEKYMNLVGCVDFTNTFVYRKTVEDWPILLNGVKWGFVASVVASGYYLFYKKEKKNGENEDV